MAKGGKAEAKFQKDLIEELRLIFKGCIILKNDDQYIQGIPDLTILYKDRYAILECKKSADAPYRPNQEYYLDILGRMSFTRTICPENKDDVLEDLKEFFSVKVIEDEI